jgi:two-component system chemotaxis response regulator CheY
MKKIIVVDDSRTARHQVIAALKSGPFEIVEAVDGKDGLDKIRAHRDAKVIVCDVNMPNMSGLEMLGVVAADPALASMPVLMLTTEAQPELVQEARRRGAKGWMVKPFKPDLLAAAVHRLAG